MDMKQFVAKRS